MIVVTGHQRDAGRGGARGPRRAARAQSGFCRRALDLAQGRARRRAGAMPTAPSSASATCRRCGADLIDRLIAAFDPERGALVVVPTIDGKRGNPVVWSRRFFPELMALEGDVGARHLIGRYAEAVTEVPLTDTAALIDVDTPEALAKVRAELEGA